MTFSASALLAYCLYQRNRLRDDPAAAGGAVGFAAVALQRVVEDNINMDQIALDVAGAIFRQGIIQANRVDIAPVRMYLRQLQNAHPNIIVDVNLPPGDLGFHNFGFRIYKIDSEGFRVELGDGDQLPSVRADLDRAASTAQELIDALAELDQENPPEAPHASLDTPMVVLPPLPPPNFPPPGRRLTDGIYQSPIDRLRSDIRTANLMDINNSEKYYLLEDIDQRINTLLNSSNLPNLTTENRQIILRELVPQLESAYLSLFSNAIVNDGIDNVMPNHVVAVDNSNVTKWTNIYDWLKSTYYQDKNHYFFDNSTPILRATATVTTTRFTVLTGGDTQFNGGIEATDDIVEVTNPSPGAHTYNINAGGGKNNVIILDTSLFTDDSTVVNIVGHGGDVNLNSGCTYVINVKNGLGGLHGKIRIFDFNPNTDHVIFMTAADNYLQPNIKETWHGEMFAPVSKYYDSQGNLSLQSKIPSWTDWVSFSLGRAITTGMRDTFEGNGIPTVELWSGPSGGQDNQSIILNSLKTTYAGDIPGDPSSPAFLIPSDTYQTSYSQFDNYHDVDCFHLGLSAGNFYRFLIKDRAESSVISDAGVISKTSLSLSMLNDNRGETSVVYSSLQDQFFHTDEISFVAPLDGSYDLYAGGPNTPKGTNTPKGMYAITYKTATPQNFTTYKDDPRFMSAAGQFKGDKDFQVFTADLKAGQYMEITDLGHTSDISIYDPLGQKIALAYQTEKVGYLEVGHGYFLANEAGRYSFVLDDNTTSPVQNFQVWLGPRSPLALSPDTLGDIEGSITTHADLKAGVTIHNTIERKGDHDYFRVNLADNTTYQFDLKRDISQNSKNNLDPYISLRGATGSDLMNDTLKHPAHDDDGGFVSGVLGSAYDSKLVYKIGTAGTYYIDAGAYSNLTLGDYSLTYKVIA